MNVLSLFAGIGGLELGLERAGMTIVGQVELDPYCRRVLAKHWPEVPRHDDVRTAVDWWRSEPRTRVDIVCGGFPCQDVSNAGPRTGLAGHRSGLWGAMLHVVCELRPRIVVLENVSALVVRGLDTVAADLAESGYDLAWDCVPAASVGAPHRRDRWFGVAYAQGQRRGQGRAGRPAGRRPHRAGQRPEALAHTDGIGRHRRTGLFGTAGWPQPTDSGWWATEPVMGRVAHGIPARMDRLRALGNAVVPQVAEHIGRLITDQETAA